MNYHGILQRHRSHVLLRGLVDAALFFGGMRLASLVRFSFDPTLEKWGSYEFAVGAGALTFASLAYIAGLYSFRRVWRWWSVVFGLLFAIGGACLLIVLLTYSVSTDAVGRGILGLGALFATTLIFLHHLVFLARSRHERERVALLDPGHHDDPEVHRVPALWSEHFQILGVITRDGVNPTLPLPVLGPISRLPDLIPDRGIDRVVCSQACLRDPELRPQLSRAFFSGVTVTPVVTVCEELQQCVPLDLVTPDWLLAASSFPNRFYLLKVKRAFDLLAALALLPVGLPLLLLGMLLVKLTSRGPVFYRQLRSGKFGRPLFVTKLRTMRTDAERNGPQWASGSGDARLTPVGGFLRKYRIDELPQLFHILSGEMSFVGPRPERPEFQQDLERRIPHFGERLMVQPGLTGWAQVNYPYGASIEDAARKLEYDFYYMKHMSLSFDLLILLDTVRIILRGGVRQVRPRLTFSRPPAAEPVCAPLAAGLSSSPHA